MDRPIVAREDWLAERKALLAEEKSFTRARDALAAKRRAMPLVRLDRPYRFATETGEKTLAGLFGPHRQLLVYHFMFGPDWEEGCPSCSFWADTFDGTLVHLAARDTAFVCVSKAPLGKLLAYRKRMGWAFPWVSAGDSGFNEEFGVTLDGSGGYNYAPGGDGRGEMPGISAFLREGDQVYHSYSAYARGLDAMNATYQLLDLTPLGRQEDDLPWPMAWLRRHDRYDVAKGDPA